jgi:hypothetical protein
MLVSRFLQKFAVTTKTADWMRAEDIHTGDTLFSPPPVFKVKQVYPEGDEIVVSGGPGMVRRFDPTDEVHVLRRGRR